VETQTNIFEDVGLVEEEREKMWNLGYVNIVILFSYIHLYNQRCDQHCYARMSLEIFVC
jgi:hypothetical protein